MDVDGTLTQCTVYYSRNGEEMKRFSLRDGMGIELLHKSGISTAIITSENSPIVISRATKLRIGSVIVGSRNKTRSLKELSDNLGIPLQEFAYVGDDINDYWAMQTAGLAVCPNDAVDVVRGISQIILDHKGGEGAVREISERILSAQGKPIVLNENW